MRSRKIRFATYAAIGLLATIGLLLIALHTPPVRRFALGQAIRLLRGQGIDFNVAQLDYNLLTLRFDLRDVRVQSRQAPDLPPLLQTGRVSVDLDLRKLIRGAYHIERAEIYNPQVHLVIAADGRDNLPRLPKSEGESTTDFDIRELHITGGAVRVEERRRQMAAYLPLQSVTLNGSRVNLQAAGGGQLTYTGRPMALRALTGEFVREADAIQIRSLRLEAGESQLALSGRVDDFNTPRLDLQGQAALALASLAEFAALPQRLRGNLDVAFTANGTLAALKATAKLRGENLAVDRWDRLALAADAAYDVAASRLRVESLTASAPWARVQGNADLALDAAQSSARVSARNVDLASLSAILRLPVRVASTAAAEVDARWPGLDFERAAGEVSLRLAASRNAPAKNVLPLDGALRARVSGNRAAIDIDRLRAAGATVSGEVAVADRKALSGTVRVEAPRLSAVAAAADAFAGKRLLETPIEGALSLTARLAGTVQAPAATATLAVPNLSAGTLQGIAVNAALDYTPQRVSVGDAAATWQNQTVRASGTAGLQGKRPLALQARGESLSIPTLLAAANRTGIPAAGELSFVAEVDGTVEHPRATVTLTGTGLQAYKESFGTLSARAQFQAQQLEVSELRLDKDAGSLRASGGYHLESKQYRFQVRGRDLTFTNTPVRGTVSVDGSGQGTMDDPAGNLRLSVRNILAGDKDYGNAEVTLAAANRQVAIEASAPKFNATATAKVGSQEPYPATVQLLLARTKLEQLPVEGTVSAVIDATGDLKNYRDGAARAEVSQLDLTFRGEPIRADGPLIARYAKGTLAIDQATVVAAGSRLTATGALPLEPGAADGAIRLNAQLDLAGLSRFVPDVQMQGAAALEGDIRGTLKRIDPALTISLENGTFSTKALPQPVTNAALRGVVRDGALELESASANWGTASFTAAGTVPFALLPANLPVELPRRQGPAKLTADIKGLTLAAIPGAPKNVSGTAGAHLEAEAAVPELQAVRATLTLPELQARLDTFELAQDGVSEIALEKGIAQIRRLRLKGPATDLQLTGTAEIEGKQALDLRLEGNLDASLAAAFSEDIRARGATEIRAAVTGTVKAPQAKGYVQLVDGQFSMQDPRIGIEGLNLRVELDGARATIARLEGQVNGGTASGQGSLDLSHGTPRESDLSVRIDDLYMDFPTGLKTVSDVRLQLRNVGERLILRGTVLVKEGGFTDDLNFDQGILAAATAPRGIELTDTERNRLLDSVLLNVAVVTQDPIAIENNIAKAEITAQLVVLGSPYNPGLAGRLVIEEGSELTLQERRYEVTRGIVTFTSERRIEPNLDIEATTTASNYDITLRISGTPGDTKTSLTAGDLSEPDILALLVTGKTLDEIRGQEFQVAQTQILSYLTGRVGATLGRQVERATGISRVRVEPNLIAAETNPGARLTVGQDITRQLEVIYSMDLVNSSDQIYIAEYDLTRRFTTRGVRQSDGSFRFDFRHDLRFGGLPDQQRRARTETRRFGNISILGESFFPETRIRDKLNVKAGDRYDFFKMRRGLDGLTKMYEKGGLLESNIRMQREQKDTTVDLTLRIEPGPVVEFVFEGADVPGGVREEVRRVWASGVFDSQRLDDSAGVLRAWLVGGSFLTPGIEPTISTPAAGRKRVLFDIQRGPQYSRVEWVFDGAQGISQERLRDVVESQELSTEVYTKPGRVTELLTQFYREMGYLDAAVTAPRYELDPKARAGRVVFPVIEGPLYRVGEARFEGNKALTDVELAATVPLPRGDEYRPILHENALQRVRDAYWERGYNEVEVEAVIERIPDGALVNFDFRITENARGIVEEIAIEGNRNTSENLIRTQLELKPGDPVNLQKVADSRRKLYNTGAFSMVDITREDMKTEQTPDKPIRLRVRVQEIRPFELRYGGFYDTERGPGGIVDLSNRNSLGSARVLGFRGRYDSQTREARVYFSQPLLSRFPLKTIASPFIRREINPETEETSGFNVDRIGFSLQQEAILTRYLVLNYGYNIERSRTYDTGADAFFDVRLRVATLTSTISRDTRDEILDATRGSFFSHAFQLSPESLGSEVRFIKYFGQYFRYFALQKPHVELFTNQVVRPRLVFATAARVGLSRGLGGQEVPLAERFLAGGATTLRGFAQNSVGPMIGTTPLGGQAMLVLNNELRFPLFSIFDGAGFLDLGNVYPSVSDLRLTDIRRAAGPGLRVRTPWFLLRLDYGIKLDRKPGESRGRFFFSIGQAF